MGKAFIVVGGTGSGKSHLIRQQLEGVNPGARMVFDVQQEYVDLYPYPLLDDEVFLEATTRVQNAVLVYEEATIFFSNRGSSKLLRRVLVGKRHTGNTIFLVFHSLRAVPRYIYDLCTHVILYKTNDTESMVSTRFENDKFTAMFLRLKDAAWINTGAVRYSPHEIFSIYGY